MRHATPIYPREPCSVPVLNPVQSRKENRRNTWKADAGGPNLAHGAMRKVSSQLLSPTDVPENNLESTQLGKGNCTNEGLGSTRTAEVADFSGVD